MEKKYFEKRGEIIVSGEGRKFIIFLIYLKFIIFIYLFFYIYLFNYFIYLKRNKFIIFNWKRNFCKTMLNSSYIKNQWKKNILKKEGKI